MIFETNPDCYDYCHLFEFDTNSNNFNFLKGGSQHMDYELRGTYHMGPLIDGYKDVTLHYKKYTNGDFDETMSDIDIIVNTKIKIIDENTYHFNGYIIRRGISTITFTNDYLPEKYIWEDDNSYVFYIIDEKNKLIFDIDGFDKIMSEHKHEMLQFDNEKYTRYKTFTEILDPTEEQKQEIQNYLNNHNQLLQQKIIDNKQQIHDHILSTVVEE